MRFFVYTPIALGLPLLGAGLRISEPRLAARSAIFRDVRGIFRGVGSRQAHRPEGTRDVQAEAVFGEPGEGCGAVRRVAEEGFAWLAGGHAGMDETDAFGKGEKGQRVTKPRSPTRKTAAWSTRRGSEQPTLNVKREPSTRCARSR